MARADSSVIGRVRIGTQASVWFGAVLRGDIDEIVLGDRSNLQDNVVVHTETGSPAIIGADVSVGHGAVVHGCRIEDGCLIGMNATVLNGAVIGAQSLVAAGAVVLEGTIIPRGHSWPASPRRCAENSTTKKSRGCSATPRATSPARRSIATGSRRRSISGWAAAD